MGVISPPDIKRNAELLKDVDSKKFTQVELVQKYKISAQRIYYIANREREKNDPKN
jgi:Mor family transcriptional regulator